MDNPTQQADGDRKSALSWLVYNWKKVAFWTTFGIAPSIFALCETAKGINASFKNGDTTRGVFILYAVDSAGKDIVWAYDNVSGATKSALGHQAQQEAIVCLIPPSLAFAGWEAPAPGSKMEAFKNAVMEQIREHARARGAIGPANEYVMVNEGVYEAFDPEGDNAALQPLLITVRKFNEAPPGHEQRFYDWGTRLLKRTP